MDSPNLETVTRLLQEAMSRGKMPFLTVTSNSMSPLLRRGDQIGLSAPDAESLAAGDVIVLQTGDHFTTHRYWETHEDSGRSWLLTRGDRLLMFDPPWSPEQYIGRVVVRRRGGRTLWLDRGAGRWLNARLNGVARLERRLIGYRAVNLTPSKRSLSQWILPWFMRRALLGYAIILSAVCAASGSRSRIDEEKTAVVLTPSSHR